MPAKEKFVGKKFCCRKSRSNRIDANSRYRMNGNFVAIVPQFLHLLIVSVLMRYIECCLHRTTVWIFSIRRKQFRCEKVEIFKIDGIIKGEYYHLWRLRRFQSIGNHRSVFRAKAFRQYTHRQITCFRRIWIIISIAPALIAAIRTIDGTVTKVFIWQTRSIGAPKLITFTTIAFLQ